MKCPSCGAENNKIAKFCTKCGTALSSSSQTSDTPTQKLSDSISETSEQINYARLWIRLGAFIIDFILLSVAFITIAALMGISLVTSMEIKDEGYTFFILAGILALSWLYNAGMESSSHQATLGKRAVGLKVTDLEGNRISFGKATVRYFFKYICIFLVNINGIPYSVQGVVAIGYLVNFLFIPFNSKKQALHDIIAHTVVIKTK